MSTASRRRPHTLQPELPLTPTAPTAPTEAGGSPASPGRHTDWHLDEQTRRLGHQGVAAARALLAGPDGDGGGKQADGDARRAGRAA
ncbi:MAG TPA: hypothetical protein VMQ59_11235 [Acidimicrobiales bacterium]|nr:hypothetical protein [Acidimicrobiales bacterium]